ncbi:MAG: hypothetical protein JSW10_11925 [Pseudomonadota bacterium]|nr:MAG: hypothetical protein JSW10_11925 [Pseudomonadota bacterium]
MKLESEWIFDCMPEHVWPHFFTAEMDLARPLGFRLGVPKPISCRVLEGEAAVGNTRQCKTDQGYIDQEILACDDNRKLTYSMKSSTLWSNDWVGELIDTFELVPLDSNRTRVVRTTVFDSQRPFKVLKRYALWFALRQAHRYASKNWRRLAYKTRDERNRHA